MNMITLAVSIANGFFIPKLITVEAYAFYKTYMLYISFVGFLHFGFINGLYLKYGAFDFEQLPKKTLRTLNRFFIFMQFSISVVLFLLSAICVTMGNGIIFVFVSANVALINIGYYFSQINQFTRRFQIERKILNIKNFLLILMVSLLPSITDKQEIYLLLYQTMVNIIVVFFMFAYNKPLIIGQGTPLSNERANINNIFKNGFFVMLSEFISIFIFGFDSFLVNIFFSTHDFAMYSFAVSLITLLFNLISSVSNVIYPYLARVDKEHLIGYYEFLSTGAILVSAFILSGNYILKIIIGRFLVKYDDCMVILLYLFPTVVFRVMISLIANNFFKVLNLSWEFIQNNIFGLILGVFSDIIFYILFKNVQLIAVASSITFLLWYLKTDCFFCKRFNINWRSVLKRYIFISITIGLYYILQKHMDFILYLLISSAFGLLMYKDEIYKIKNLFCGL